MAAMAHPKRRPKCCSPRLLEPAVVPSGGGALTSSEGQGVDEAEVRRSPRSRSMAWAAIDGRDGAETEGKGERAASAERGASWSHRFD